MPAETGLSSPWTVRYSRSKRREYFFNPETRASQWEEPEGTNVSQLKQYLTDHPLHVRCLHILIKHSGSRRPASHRSDTITISEEEAIKELTQLQERLQEGKSHGDGRIFEKLAEERSDCSSYKRGGDLGTFGRGEMQPAFEKVAFGLKIGEISGIVKTDSGVHLIKRVA